MKTVAVSLVSALGGLIVGVAAGAGGTYMWSKSQPASLTVPAGTATGPSYAAYVKLFLNDPESAQFRSVRRSSNSRYEAWCGEVNARNKMGGMAGFTRFVVVLPDRELNVDPVADPNRALIHTTIGLEDSEGFAGKWSVYCG